VARRLHGAALVELAGEASDIEQPAAFGRVVLDLLARRCG